MSIGIVSIGLANPGNPIDQSSIACFMQKAHQLNELDSRKLSFLYRKSGISTRHSVLRDFEKSDAKDFSFFPSTKDFEPFPSTKARMEVFRQTAPQLCEEAVKNCLSKTDVNASEITHLILVSCTGMVAPGVELELMRMLDLEDSVERYCVHFMGCYAAFTGLKLADKIVKAEPDAKVLMVSVELCTLHFQKEYVEDNILANSLFGDGAAAALVMKSESGLKIKSYLSQLLREGENDMAWGIGDFGFEMRLSKYIPTLLDQGINKLKSKFEEKFKLSTINNFAIHPGGKQILQKVQEAFDLPASANIHATAVLNQFGNMSSATILFVLERMMHDEAIRGEILSMGFGPGLTLETLLLEKG
ncbi:putative naringenin-chalcone synthase [Algoriphagus ratkowskyi]|uniref:Putative naringenin-chalcone synthase n=1 Tax=Algoriphagus ratkowskyi TaxID=57028 RepID=A0A2W7RJE9_9BACT|nr:type III polyketide synthase [Algoriphagus ratkowskyi]PZX54609.1 putative naringenin-chalcone synthase [Algoriphagus ratkowskyi]TXD76922.1 type III polyketide synthase [Algoriphagus ratkowskyi]